MTASPGFVLPAVLLVILILSGLGLLIHQQCAASLETSQSVIRELQALTLAQNGIRAAQAVLARNRASVLLAGADGVTGCPGAHNPVDFEAARTLDPETWSAPCDDGFPEPELGRFQPLGRTGYFLFRFSNNPEEGGSLDRDGILLARSLGLVPDPRCRPGSCAHHLALVEARFRRELAFAVDTAFTLMGPGLELEWGDRSLPGPEPWFTTVETGAAGLIETLQATTHAGAFKDETAPFMEDPNRRRLLEHAYWAHLYGNLENFRPPGTEPGAMLHYLPAGGSISADCSGVLFARGTVVFEPTARFKGLVIHMGGGTLVLESGSQLDGAVWMSGFPSNPGPEETLKLTVKPGALVRFDGRIVREATAELPPTQLGWRIIFPEMG